MNSIAKPIPRKNTKISFRTDELTLAKLRAFCRVKNRTISSLIENVLMDHVLRIENPLFQNGDKRQTPRKECLLPAIIYLLTKDTKKYFNGNIVNISKSSIQLLLRKQQLERSIQDIFYVLFTIPNFENPILAQCKHIRSNFLHEDCFIIAQLDSNDLFIAKAINNYISMHDLSNSINKYQSLR